MHQSKIEGPPKRSGYLADRPALAAILGALVIATSAILFRLAEVTPLPPPSFVVSMHFHCYF